MLQKLCRSYFGSALPAADNSCCPGMAQCPFSCQCITPHHVDASSQPPPALLTHQQSDFLSPKCTLLRVAAVLGCYPREEQLCSSRERDKGTCRVTHTEVTPQC